MLAFPAPNFDRLPARHKVQLLESAMAEEVEAGNTIDAEKLCKLYHRFADGLYMRELHVPAGVLSTGKIHKHEHLGILLKGTREVLIEGKLKLVIAPFATTIRAGSKLACYTWEDSIWVTVHPNPDNERSIETLERRYVAETEAEYLAFLETERKEIECRS